MARKPHFSIHILRAYYPFTASLVDYFKQTGGAQNNTAVKLMHETDTKQYRDLLSTTVVASKDMTSIPLNLKPSKPLGPLRELIDRAQRKLLRNGAPHMNVLTSGYQLGASNTRHNGAGISGNTILESRFVNTVITAFESPAWATLYDRVGDDIMFYLLTETSVFVPLPNDCYCQIAGPPIIDLPAPALNQSLNDRINVKDDTSFIRSVTKRTSTSSVLQDRPRKRQRLSAPTAGKLAAVSKSSGQPVPEVQQSRPPADVLITRSRLFYYRPSGSSRNLTGLPATHILNRLSVRGESVQASTTPDPRGQAENARHLAKYVFPAQFGLSSALFDVQISSAASPDYTNREREIKTKGAVKTPKRLKPVLDLLEKMTWRHGKCRYRALLSKTCPSKVKTNAKSLLDSSIILEMMSEDSFQLHTQGRKADNSTSFDSTGQPILSHGLTQTKQQAKQKPRFAEFICSYNEVYCYAVAVTKSVVPMQFWGSKRNFEIIRRNIKTLIAMRRYETLTLHRLMQDVAVSECDWLTPTGHSSPKQQMPISDTMKRLELLQEFMYWYFDSFLIPLLKATFYVTESQAFRNKVLYFRQDDWELLCRPLVERLCADTFQKLRREDAEEILRQRRLGYSFVRLLPKETGVRPIINLRRREASTPFKRSINQILKAAFHILTFEKDAQRKLIGASVFGLNEIYMKLRAFKANLRREFPEDLPKLYFVKMDVQACFDTIDQTKLLQILLQVLKEGQYIIQRHGQIFAHNDKIRRNFISTAMPSDDYPHFLSLASQLASALRNTIFVDKVVYPYAKRQEIIELLEQHITDNIVKIGSDYYRQVVGIPQGSILSTLLCSFFYGDLERSQLKFTEDPHTVLLRLVDDYLLITTDRKRARHFYDVMSKGHPEYGCFISQEKTLTSFDDCDILNVVDPGQRGFPWCGFRIDMKDLSVSADCTRWNTAALRDSFTVDLGRHPGAAFAQKMLALARAKSHMIYNDCRLNCLRNVYKNIYQSFCLTAIKMHFYIRGWKPNMARSAAFITSTARQVIRYSYAAMRTKSKSKLSKTYGAQLEAQKGPVIWLGTHAFHTVLSRKSHEYEAILRSLEFDMRLSQYSRCRKLLKGVVKEGLATLTMLDF